VGVPCLLTVGHGLEATRQRGGGGLLRRGGADAPPHVSRGVAAHTLTHLEKANFDEAQEITCQGFKG
jgi:hypothetical protein